MTTPQDPQNPYGAPPPPPPPPPGYPQQPYGYPAYGQQPQQQDAPKGMAITALILAFLGCTGILAVVSIVMSIVVLVRGKDGRNHGKGLAIGAICVSVVSLAIGGVAVALGVYLGSLTDVADLEAGDCITASGLADDGADTVTSIKTVSCSTSHDGEVLATAKLTAEQADQIMSSTSSVCPDAIVAAGKAPLITDELTFVPLTAPDPGAGDKVACVAYNSDGSSLSKKLG
jgi:hypothetical protein